MKRNMLRLVLGGLILAGVGQACAQEDKSPSVQRPKDTRTAPATLTPAQYLRMIEKLQKETIQAFEADEELATELRDVFEKYVRQVQEQIETQRDARRDMVEESRELMRGLREAREEGDRERAQELREELTELRRDKGEAEYVHEDLFNDVHELLNENEVEKFDRLADAFEQQLARKSHPATDKLSILSRVVTTLQLEPDQREAVLEVLKDAKRKAAEVKGDPEKIAALFETAGHDIREELNEEQVDRFDQRLEKALQSNDPRQVRPVRERTLEQISPAKPDDADRANEEAPEPAEPPAEEDGA